MTWSRSFESLEDFMKDKGTPDAPRESPAINAYIVARRTAERIIESKVIGGNGSLSGANTAQGANNKDFRVTFLGHSNPDNEPIKGWANDMLTVTVAQK